MGTEENADRTVKVRGLLFNAQGQLLVSSTGGGGSGTVDQGQRGSEYWLTELAAADPGLVALAAALESVTATIANWPADFPDAASLSKLEEIRALLAATLTVAISGDVDLSAATLAALESITATVANWPADFPDAAVAAALATVTTGLASIYARQADRSQFVRVTDGTNDAEVNARADGTVALETMDDCQELEAQHLTLVASTDTEVTFSAPVRIVRILNWDTARRVLFKQGAIADDTDATASRVGFAPTTSVPGTRTLPLRTASINLRSAGASECTVEGYR